MTGGLKSQVLSVNVALPRLIGEHQGAPLLSAFQKRPVTTATIAVGPLGLAGDGHADLENHVDRNAPSTPIWLTIGRGGKRRSTLPARPARSAKI